MESQEQTHNNPATPCQRLICPVCNRTVRRSGQEASKQMKCFPFCSERCKLIDLGAWLETDYRILCTGDEESQGPLSQDPLGLEDPL